MIFGPKALQLTSRWINSLPESVCKTLQLSDASIQTFVTSKRELVI